MFKIYFIALALIGHFACKSIDIDNNLSASEAGDFSLVLANGDFAESGFLFYRIRADKEVNEVFQIIPPPFKGEISIRAIGCGDGERFLDTNGSMDPVSINFKDLVVFKKWPNKEVCEFFISGKFQSKVNDEIKTQIANAFVKVIVFDSSYNPLTLNSPYSDFRTKYKGQEIVYSTKLRSAVESPLEEVSQ